MLKTKLSELLGEEEKMVLLTKLNSTYRFCYKKKNLSQNIYNIFAFFIFFFLLISAPTHIDAPHFQYRLVKVCIPFLSYTSVSCFDGQWATIFLMQTQCSVTPGMLP